MCSSGVFFNSDEMSSFGCYKKREEGIPENRGTFSEKVGFVARKIFGLLGDLTLNIIEYSGRFLKAVFIPLNTYVLSPILTRVGLAVRAALRYAGRFISSVDKFLKAVFRPLNTYVLSPLLTRVGSAVRAVLRYADRLIASVDNFLKAVFRPLNTYVLSPLLTRVGSAARAVLRYANSSIQATGKFLKACFKPVYDNVMTPIGHSISDFINGIIRNRAEELTKDDLIKILQENQVESEFVPELLKDMKTRLRDNDLGQFYNFYLQNGNRENSLEPANALLALFLQEEGFAIENKYIKKFQISGLLFNK